VGLAGACLWLVAASPQQDVHVVIDNFSFNPSSVTIPVGTVVVWTNHDDIPHTVTSADAPRRFGSAPLDTDEQFSSRFDHAGRFTYFCSLHAHMQGVVVVR
jgi:plastocyanin